MVKKTAAETKSEAFHVVRLWLPDGSTVAGLWTGTKWWAKGREVFPTHWSELDAPHIEFQGPK